MFYQKLFLNKTPFCISSYCICLLGTTAVGYSYIDYHSNKKFQNNLTTTKVKLTDLYKSRPLEQLITFFKNKNQSEFSKQYMSTSTVVNCFQWQKESSKKQHIGNDSNNESSAHITEEHPLWRSKANRQFEKKVEETAIFAGNSNVPLAQAIAHCLGSSLGNVRVGRFADGEVNLQYLDSLRGKDVFLIQATSPPVNEHLIELLLMISTAKRSSAKKITAVIPYFGYARQDRKLHSRVPISAADVARMIETMGVDRVVSVDLHCGQIQGFFGPHVPVDNLEAELIGLDYFITKNLKSPVIVSPDAGGVYRARKFQEGFLARGIKETGIAMLIKQRLRANEVEHMDFVGNVHGCDCIIVDDMIDTAGTLCEAAAQLRARGAQRVFAFATHGLLSGQALKRIENSNLEEVVVTDSIKQHPNTLKSKKIKQLSIAPLIADAIRRIHQKESLQQLFTV